MGHSEVDESVTIRIGTNVEYLNQEFEGRIKFRLNRLFMDPNGAYLPDLHQLFNHKDQSQLDALIEPIEQKGAINIFLFETYTRKTGAPAMMGFTPILREDQNSYAFISPQFDRLFIAYPGLFDGSTLIHEMGHFLGLSHPWEMEIEHQRLLGFCTCQKDDKNHMSYNETVDHFTTQQLDIMHRNTMTYRQYLLSHIEVRN